ncbi:MAG TPA: pitrilysin family protein [Candidatus Hydrothermia bacterium]|nr:insulinase family protein [Candidatus Hydrothermae bacterium]MDD3649812.1 pitrilysin family protein [Candidatus Hydrothermia bacterium]MDD5572457.1 pitrilysin family protein [Candidatus Hydrothermia bacterium]HOK23394.1 pitrilysin family protein [Candidatus Hydrothermia bacterium]HOL24204.1 pitrilysin family protein [Candidatus Hydrothermia bacterium]
MELVIEKRNLGNGLKVVVNEDKYSPMVASAILYGAGSRTEREGITGISHILEHMMFKGTKNLASEDYSKKIQKTGGYDNAYTSKDYTIYYAFLPVDGLETFLSMEADRMVNLEITDFEEEMEVVKDERRYTTLDNPVECFMEKFWLTLFQVHPYRFPVIGFMEDLEKISLHDVLEYYNALYVPSNAILVVAGGVSPDKVFSLADKYFGSIIKSSDFNFANPSEPLQSEKRFLKIKKKYVSPMISLGFKTAAFGHRHMYALDVLGEVLCGGKWGVLVRELVYNKGIFTSLNCESSFLKDSGLFTMVGVPVPGIDIFKAVEILEKGLWESKDKINIDMVNTAKSKLLTEFFFNIESVRDVVFELGEFELCGTAEDINRYPEELKKVSLGEVTSLFKSYLVEERETLGVLYG